MTRDELIEAMSRAWCGCSPSCVVAECREDVRLAIKAAEDAGFALVPKELSQESADSAGIGEAGIATYRHAVERCRVQP